MTCGGPVQGFANVNQGSSMGTAWGHSNTNDSPFTGNPLSESQCIYSGERSGGPRDRVIPVGDSGFGRDSNCAADIHLVAGDTLNLLQRTMCLQIL